jgi:hypothetical protein
MTSFDAYLIGLVNQLVGRSRTLDTGLALLQKTNLMTAELLVSAYWWGGDATSNSRNARCIAGRCGVGSRTSAHRGTMPPAATASHSRLRPLAAPAARVVSVRCPSGVVFLSE